jgi:hypothetical protein
MKLKPSIKIQNKIIKVINLKILEKWIIQTPETKKRKKGVNKAIINPVQNLKAI